MGWIVAFILVSMGIQAAFANYVNKNPIGLPMAITIGILTSLVNMYAFLFIGGTWPTPYFCGGTEWPHTYPVWRAYGVMLLLIVNGLYALGSLDHGRKLIKENTEREAFKREVQTWLL